MSWYAYCITEQKAFLGSVRSRRPFPIEQLSGVNGSQVFAYPSGELAVIVSEYSPGDLDQQAVIEHARVVRVLPQHDGAAVPFWHSLR